MFLSSHFAFEIVDVRRASPVEETALRRLLNGQINVDRFEKSFGFVHKQSDESSLLALFSLKSFLIFTQQWRLIFLLLGFFLIKRISSLKASSKSLHLKCFYRSNKELFIIIISLGVGDALQCLDGSIKTKKEAR